MSPFAARASPGGPVDPAGRSADARLWPAAAGVWISAMLDVGSSNWRGEFHVGLQMRGLRSRSPRAFCHASPAA